MRRRQLYGKERLNIGTQGGLFFLCINRPLKKQRRSSGQQVRKYAAAVYPFGYITEI